MGKFILLSAVLCLLFLAFAFADDQAEIKETQDSIKADAQIEENQGNFDTAKDLASDKHN